MNNLPPASVAGGGAMAGFGQSGGPPQQGAQQADKKAQLSPFDTALQSYRGGRFDEAAHSFDGLAGADPNADLWAARSVRESKGCRNAVARFDKVAQRAAGTPPGWDALLEGALCYRSIGNFDQARVRLNALLTVDSHKDRRSRRARSDHAAPAGAGQHGASRRRRAPLSEEGRRARRHRGACELRRGGLGLLMMKDRDALVGAWSAKDRARAVLPADREIVDASATIRALIVDLVLAGGPEDELYDASAVLGRLIAQRGGSPTLASATLDHAADVLDARSSPWLVPARAAVAEGFAATLVEDAQLEAMRTWEFPSCAVPLGHAGLAICAGHPSDDDESWRGGRPAWPRRRRSAGVRRAVLSGGERASAALVDALTLVGIEVNAAPKPR